MHDRRAPTGRAASRSAAATTVVELSERAGLRRLPLRVPAAHLALQEAVRAAEVRRARPDAGSTACNATSVSTNCSQAACAAARRYAGNHLGTIEDDPVDEAHQVERRAEHACVVAQRDRPRQPARRCRPER